MPMLATQAILAIWTPEQITNFVIALTGLVTGITALYKIIGISTAAAAAGEKAKTASEKADTNAHAMNGLQQQLTQIALQTPPPPSAPTSPVVPVAWQGKEPPK